MRGRGSGATWPLVGDCSRTIQPYLPLCHGFSGMMFDLGLRLLDGDDDDSCKADDEEGCTNNWNWGGGTGEECNADADADAIGADKGEYRGDFQGRLFSLFAGWSGLSLIACEVREGFMRVCTDDL